MREAGQPSMFEQEAGSSRNPEPTAERSEPAHSTEKAYQELMAQLERIEASLDAIRGAVAPLSRERQHKEYSPARLAGAVLQSVVVGLGAWALSDWLFRMPVEGMYVKLAFASVVQLMALTAFVASQRD